MSKGIKRLLVFVILFIVVGLVAVYVFVDRQATFAQNVDTENNHYQIIGKSTDLIDGWSISFCWRRVNGPWMLYYLDHESSRWTNVKINLQSDRVLVLRDAKEVGYLELQDGTFHLPDRDQIQRTPVKIVAASDPFSDSASVYPGSQDWENVWPKAMNAPANKQATH